MFPKFAALKDFAALDICLVFLLVNPPLLGIIVKQDFCLGRLYGTLS